MTSFKSSRIQLIFIIAAALLLLLSVFSYLRINNLTKTSEWVNHTTLVKLQLNNIYISTYEAEADSRGFVLTKDPIYLERMRHNLFVLDSQKVYLRELIKDNFSQRQNFRKLDSILNKRVTFMKDIVNDSPLGKIPKERWLKGRKIMIDLRSHVNHMVTEEDMQYKLRNKTLVEQTVLTPLFSIFLTFLSLLILVTSYLIIFRELRISNQLKTDLESSRQHLLESNKSLLEKNASLDAMNKELESFTYISSHDLQEPLRKIQTFISRIGEDSANSFTESSANYLNRTQEAARRMQNLIQDLLAYSRVKKEVFLFEKYSFRELVNEVTEELSEEIELNASKITTEGNDEIEVIPVQFRQLLINLISNAIKFKAEGVTPKIKVRHEIVDHVSLNDETQYGTFSKMTVSDNGIGIEPQYQKRIFEVFQRLHTKEEYSGTGVGLAIVKKIIENHNGFIDIESKPGKGSSFIVYWPITLAG
ncbi:sensor histidine kinase [Flavobacterium silvaticum]|uniref:histidine kinase n=1 Tax=Flavobacterium silvaticum TaxID=1852020 RepID=A0A972G1M8_9FLAO|nr:ATP-binding protein [Flavobacterium silvaticum]NMH28806.1 hypothetical protein [Flavobacterium silvaticum]